MLSHSTRLLLGTRFVSVVLEVGDANARKINWSSSGALFGSKGYGVTTVSVENWVFWWVGTDFDVHSSSAVTSGRVAWRVIYARGVVTS